MTEKLTEAAIIIALMVVAYILAIIIHEFGHMCMGALSGYSFVSFRIGPIEIVNESGHAKDAIRADEERQRIDVIIRSVCSGEAKMEKKLIEMVQGE